MASILSCSLRGVARGRTAYGDRRRRALPSPAWRVVNTRGRVETHQTGSPTDQLHRMGARWRRQARSAAQALEEGYRLAVTWSADCSTVLTVVRARRANRQQLHCSLVGMQLRIRHSHFKIDKDKVIYTCHSRKKVQYAVPLHKQHSN